MWQNNQELQGKLLFSCFTVTFLQRLDGLKLIHVYLKIGEKQDIVFPRPILERNEIFPISRSHTSLSSQSVRIIWFNLI